MRFRPFSTIHTNTICMRFHFHPLPRVFSNRCVFDENPHRMSVDGRPKRIEMYTFLKRKRIIVDGALNSTKIVKYVTLMMTDVPRSKHAGKLKKAVLFLWQSLLYCCWYLDLFDEFIPGPSWRAAQHLFISIWQCQFLSREIKKVFFFFSNLLFADALSRSWRD